jgi:hypothetical protein
MSVLNTKANKMAQAAALEARIAEFQENGGTIKRRRGTVAEVSAPPANYYTSADAPAPVEKLNTWETALLKLAALGNEHPNCIKVQWGNDGRVASTTAELYGI